MIASVLITGGANGIGLASAKAFHRQGYRVAIADLDAVAANAAAQSLGNQAMGLGMDVRDRQSTQQAFDAVLARFGQINVVHANAGVSSMRRASAYRLLAASPTTGSVRMSGNLPANSHALKNGIQST